MGRAIRTAAEILSRATDVASSGAFATAAATTCTNLSVPATPLLTVHNGTVITGDHDRLIINSNFRRSGRETHPASQHPPPLQQFVPKGQHETPSHPFSERLQQPVL